MKNFAVAPMKTPLSTLATVALLLLAFNGTPSLALAQAAQAQDITPIHNSTIAPNISTNNSPNNSPNISSNTTTINQVNPGSALVQNISVIKAFEEICIKTAPSFANAMVVSADYGILDFIQFGEVRLGATQDSSISLELIENKECIVSTKTLKDGNPLKQLQQKVVQFTDDAKDANEVAQALHAPFKARLNGQNFVFKHNQEEGETFLMLNLGS